MVTTAVIPKMIINNIILKVHISVIPQRSVCHNTLPDMYSLCGTNLEAHLYNILQIIDIYRMWYNHLCQFLQPLV